ncbi:MAG: hypothetical protein M3O30_16650 [Planctomycetota bacterium]|nr:hypothetical protein [Planctomycetota bacterium]
MAGMNRRFEIHSLTISGIVDGSDYRNVILDSRAQIKLLEEAIWKHGGKSHALEEYELTKDKSPSLRLKFISFKTGRRPDVLDTSKFVIQPNPLRRNQTGVDYTHAILVQAGDKWLMVIEKNGDGIFPGSIGLYLNWMLDRTVAPKISEDEEIVVSVEPEPGQAFIQRINGLDRITEATLRLVKPNPGWEDLESELGSEANTSRARRAEITMAAKPRQSLTKTTGIVGRIRALFNQRLLGYAAIVGKRDDGTEDRFNTKQLIRKENREVQLDENGQIVSEDAYNAMDEIIKPDSDQRQ